VLAAGEIRQGKGNPMNWTSQITRDSQTVQEKQNKNHFAGFGEGGKMGGPAKAKEATRRPGGKPPSEETARKKARQVKNDVKPSVTGSI